MDGCIEVRQGRRRSPPSSSSRSNLVGGVAVRHPATAPVFGEAIKTYSLLTVGDGLVRPDPALLISLSVRSHRHPAPDRAWTSVPTCCPPVHPGTRRRAPAGGRRDLAVAIVPARSPQDPRSSSSAGRCSCWQPTAAERREIGSARGGRLKSRDRTRRAVAGLARRLVARCASSPSSSRSRRPHRPRRSGQGGDLLDACARSGQAPRSSSRGHPARADARQPRAAGEHYAVRVNGVDVGPVKPPRVTSCPRRRRGLAPGNPTREPSSGFPPRGADRVPAPGRDHRRHGRRPRVGHHDHLAEVVRPNAGRLLSRQDVKMLIDVVKQSDPVVVDELNGASVTTGEIQRVLQMLLDERSASRPRPHLEVVSERSRVTKDPEQLGERLPPWVRSAGRAERRCEAPRAVPDPW